MLCHLDFFTVALGASCVIYFKESSWSRLFDCILFVHYYFIGIDVEKNSKCTRFEIDRFKSPSKPVGPLAPFAPSRSTFCWMILNMINRRRKLLWFQFYFVFGKVSIFISSSILSLAPTSWVIEEVVVEVVVEADHRIKADPTIWQAKTRKLHASFRRRSRREITHGKKPMILMSRGYEL